MELTRTARSEHPKSSSAGVGGSVGCAQSTGSSCNCRIVPGTGETQNTQITVDFSAWDTDQSYHMATASSQATSYAVCTMC